MALLWYDTISVFCGLISIAEQRFDTDLGFVVFQPTKCVGGQSEQIEEYDHGTYLTIMSSRK
jgi:hypothetical protein